MVKTRSSIATFKSYTILNYPIFHNDNKNINVFVNILKDKCIERFP